MPQAHVDRRVGVFSTAFASRRSASISTARTVLSTREMVSQAVLATGRPFGDTQVTALGGAARRSKWRVIIDTTRGLGDRMPQHHVDWRRGIFSAAFATRRSASISTARAALSARELVPDAVLAADGPLPDTCATAPVGACHRNRWRKGGVIDTRRGLGDRMPQPERDRRGVFPAAFATRRSASISTARTALSTRELVTQAVLAANGPVPNASTTALGGARHRSKWWRNGSVIDTRRGLGDWMPQAHVDRRVGVLSTAFAARRSASISTARTSLSTREMVSQAVLAALGPLPDTGATALVGARGIRCDGGVIDAMRGLGDRMPQAHVDWRRGILSAAFAALRSASVSAARTALSTGEMVPQAVLAHGGVIDTGRGLADRMPQMNWLDIFSTASAARRNASISTARAALCARELAPGAVLAADRP